MVVRQPGRVLERIVVLGALRALHPVEDICARARLNVLAGQLLDTVGVDETRGHLRSLCGAPLELEHVFAAVEPRLHVRERALGILDREHHPDGQHQLAGVDMR